MATVQTAPCSRCGKTQHNPHAFKVECSECHRFWHHRCHIPPISDDELVARVKAANANDVDNGLAGWICRECLGKMGVSQNTSPVKSSRPANAQQSTVQRSNYTTSNPQSLPSGLPPAKKHSAAKVLKYKQSTAQKRPALPGPSRPSDHNNASERMPSTRKDNMTLITGQTNGGGLDGSPQVPRVDLQCAPHQKKPTDNGQAANPFSTKSVIKISVVSSTHKSPSSKVREPVRGSQVEVTAVDAGRFSKQKQTTSSTSQPGFGSTPQANESAKLVESDRRASPSVPGAHSGHRAQSGSNTSRDDRRGPDRHRSIIAPQVIDVDDDMQGLSGQISGPITHVSSLASSPPADVSNNLPEQSLVHTSLSDAEQYLRHQLGFPRDKPVNLWALQNPPDRQKPNHPYSTLIKLAIFGSPNKTLTLQEIYKAFIDRFEWFRDNSDDMAWKNSIRQNLSHHNAFIMLANAPDKGEFWSLDLSQLKIVQAADQSNSQRPHGGTTPSATDRSQERQQFAVHSSPVVHTHRSPEKSLEPPVNPPVTLAVQTSKDEDVDMDDDEDEDDLYGPLPEDIHLIPRRDEVPAPSMEVDNTEISKGPPNSASPLPKQPSNKPVNNGNQETSWMHGRFAHVAGDPWDRLLRRKGTSVVRWPRAKVQAKKLDSNHTIKVENLVNFSVDDWINTRRGK